MIAPRPARVASGQKPYGAVTHSAWALVIRSVEAGYLASIAGGRIGRSVRLPPQFGQTPPKRSSAQRAQKVHSKVQILASGLAGGRSQSQHSQLGRSWSMAALKRAGTFGQSALTPPKGIATPRRPEP
jgi:hypothetical protein